MFMPSIFNPKYALEASPSSIKPNSENIQRMHFSQFFLGDLQMNKC